MDPIFSPSIGNPRSRLTAIKSTQSVIRAINAKHAGGDEDLLAEIGYKQELKRTFSTFQVFGIAYSIMGLLPSIASMIGTGYTAGPGGFLWSWICASFFILSVGVSMAEMSSAIPTSGGLYYWTFYYASDSFRVPISFVIGLSNSMALCSGLVSIDYGCAEEILSAVYLTKDGNIDVSSGMVYGTFCACVVAQAICTCLSSRNVAWLQTTSAVANTGLIVLYLIALPIGTSKGTSVTNTFNDAKFIFGKVSNYSDWPTGFQFILSMMTAVWTIGCFDSCVHMSEEAKNASYGVPIGIIGSISFCATVGFFIIVCTNACISPDIQAVLETDTGFPMAQIIFDALGRKWAIALMSLMAVCQWLMGSSILTALSRQVWAFARDDGLPFSSFVKVVDKRLKVPLRAVFFAMCVALLIGCLCLAGPAASNALFSLSVSGNYLAWCTPIFLRLTTGKDRFHPGRFYLGHTLSTINSWLSCCWGAFIITISMFPATTTVDKTNMNYTCVISCGVWILAAVYFYVYKYKYFHGPKSNLVDSDDEVVSEEIPMEISKLS
ncbi:DEKNAAC100948 [Brettanomyces naardenensis]|uniref:DEKNAAC100948 n=1 Tax=Brettanomyces naardenensis TaxID=13370 RepID=A0A448YH22_BRENA|nr:DEKNAAC100948 [Brettanomyces naardenensis]